MTINFLMEILSVKSLNMDDVNVKLCLLKGQRMFGRKTLNPLINKDKSKKQIGSSTGISTNDPNTTIESLHA